MRKKEFQIEREKDGLKKITAEMEDEFHHINLRVWIEDENLRIVKIHLDMFRYPEPACIKCEGNLQKLIGASLQHPNFRRKLLRTVGGERGCFHVLELLSEVQDYSRAHVWDQRPDKTGHYKISKANQEDAVRCIAYRRS